MEEPKILKVCIGIVCIGQKYLKEFEETFKPSVVAYCKKYGYDLKVFTDFIGQRHPDLISFEKCLVPSQLMEYDCVVVMDADIYIHDYAFSIHTMVTDKIGIVDEVAQISPEDYRKIDWLSQPIEYYRLAGFNLQTDKILNTGVMLCKPSLHAEFMKGIYDKYSQSSIGHPRGFHYEQACIGYELQTHGFFLLRNTWNHIYIFNKLLNIAFVSPFFVHFAGLSASRKIELSKYLTAQRPQSVLRWGKQK